MKVTVSEIELPPSLEGRTLAVRNFVHDQEGRAFLAAIGLKTEEEMQRRQHQQHRRGAKTRSGPFFGWDGEGVTDKNGRHRYVLLNCSTVGALYNPKGIPTLDCLRFLCDVANDHPKANHVMYGGSYDANMILGDISYGQAKRLSETGHLHWGDFRIEYRQRKFFRVSRYHPGERHLQANRTATITIWDVIGFFQCSFVKALEQWLDETDDIAFIKKMKETRSEFDIRSINKIKRYCVRECELLESLMVKLRNHMRVVDLAPNRWDGAGALAGTMLHRNKMHQYYPATSKTPDGSSVSGIPPEVQEASQYAYFGGRIEMVRYGNYEGSIYAHDLVSAYPSAMVNLPCLAHGKWEKGYGTDFSLCHITFDGQNLDDYRRVFPLPWRSPKRQVFFPPKLQGWYWWPEVQNLTKHWPNCFTIDKTRSWYQECDHQPFDFVPKVFKYRQDLKRRGHHANIVLKLGLNSLYGKLAQQVGWSNGKGPTWHNLLWAGYITSVTRARLYDLAMTNPDAVIAFETDGVYTTEPLTENGNGDLGTWEVTEYEGLTYVQSGVYWVKGPCSPTCKEGCDGWHPKYRGMDPGTISRDMVLNAWDHNELELFASSTRFHGMATSTVSPERFLNWGQWVTEPRTIALRSTGKRLHHPDCTHSPLHRTVATGGGGSHSTKHPLAWLDDDSVTTMDDPYYMAQAWLAEQDDY